MLSLFIFLCGLTFGSFLNVLADRFSRNESVIKGRSHCESCKKTLGVLDLVPVFSFLYLRGRCRYCKKKLSLYYPLVEVTTGILFVVTFFVLTEQSSMYYVVSSRNIINLLYYLFLVSCLIVVFFADIKYGIIPDKIIFPAILISFLYILLTTSYVLLANILSALGAFLFFFVIFLLTHGKGMGFGDVKFAFLMGLVLGFPDIVVSLYIAFLTGALVSLILIVGGKKKLRGSTIPFGPFLVFGMLVTLYFGEIIKQFALFQFLH